jgi:hypothetical protein
VKILLKPADDRWARVLKERARKNPKLRTFYLSKVEHIQQAVALREANPPWLGKGLRWLTDKAYREEVRLAELAKRKAHRTPQPPTNRIVRALDREDAELRQAINSRLRGLQAIGELRMILEGTARVPKRVLRDLKCERTTFDRAAKPLEMTVTPGELIIDAVIKSKILKTKTANWQDLVHVLGDRHLRRVWRRWQPQYRKPIDGIEYDTVDEQSGASLCQWREFARAERALISPKDRQALTDQIEEMRLLLPPPIEPKDMLRALRRENQSLFLVKEAKEQSGELDFPRNGSLRITRNHDLTTESLRGLQRNSGKHVIDRKRLDAAWRKFMPLWLEDVASVTADDAVQRKIWDELVGNNKPMRKGNDNRDEVELRSAA